MVKSQPSLTSRFSAAICDGLANPGLQTLHGLVVAFFDLGEDGFEVGLFGVGEAWKGEHGGSSGRAYDKVAAIHIPWIHGREGNAGAEHCLEKSA